MKALISVQNIQERQTLKGLLTDFKEIIDSRSLVETIDVLCRADGIGFVVLDERSGNCLQALETLTLIHSQTPPVVLILVDERVPAGAADWKPESERLNAYAELGAELFLHRPFGLGELKTKTAQALSWVTALPPWVQLMRVSRVFLKNQQADKIMSGLEVMVHKMPEDLNISLLYAKALVACKKPRLKEACDFLKKLNDKFPACPPLLKILTDTYLSMNDPTKASFAALELVAAHSSNPHWDFFWNIFNQWIETKNPDFKMLNQYFLLIPGDGERAREMRLLFYKRMVKQAQGIVEITVLINHSEQFSATLSKSWAETESLIDLTEKFLAENKGDVVGLRNLGLLLERMLDHDPANSKYLEKYVLTAIQTGAHAQAESRLRRARVSGHKSFEFHVAAARLAVARTDIETARREASYAQPFLNSEIRRHAFGELLNLIQGKQGIA